MFSFLYVVPICLIPGTTAVRRIVSQREKEREYLSPPLLLVMLVCWSRPLKHHRLEAELTEVNWLTVLGARSPRSECQQDPVLMEALPFAYWWLCSCSVFTQTVTTSSSLRALIPSKGPHIPDYLDSMISSSPHKYHHFRDWGSA